MQLINRIDNLGRRETTTVAASTNQRVFAGTTSPTTRQSVNLCNLDVSSDLYVALSPAGGADPGLATTNADLVIPAKASREILIGTGIDLWVRTSGSTAAAYCAQEFL